MNTPNLRRAAAFPEGRAEPQSHVIAALIAARRERGMTQQALAERVGIRQSVISRIERGGGNPSLKTLERLAQGLGLRIELTADRP